MKQLKMNVTIQLQKQNLQKTLLNVMPKKIIYNLHQSSKEQTHDQ